MMKRILSSPDPSEMAQLKDLLERAGIACFMRNEMTGGLAPGIPMYESTPELWIQNDADAAEALQLKSTWKAAAKVEGTDWVCTHCGETSEPQFSSCWKCGANKV